jgi:hypothetical protein
VHDDRHSLWPVGDRRVERSGVEVRERIRIVAAGAAARPEFLVAQEGEARVVDLQIAAPRGREVADFLPVDAADVAPELIEIRIGFAVDCRPSAAVIENGR